MNEKILTLTPADMNAVSLRDSNYISGKGENCIAAEGINLL